MLREAGPDMVSSLDGGACTGDSAEHKGHRGRAGAGILRGSGPVAQSVEQRTENPCVGGSIPPQATSLQCLQHENVLQISIART